MNPSSERVGRYQLLEPIGVGPCGTVSRAKVFGVAGFERQFAVKRFHAELTVTSTLASALSAAARAYGSLEHPRIARMSEFGVAQGTTFTAVELVPGLDAARLIAEAKLAGATLAAGGALALVSQAARAVGYAHGRGLTHLGLAPTNVIVTADGDIKITDFGILAAGLPQRPIDVARLAQRIQYLAPEQVANEATSAATDVFALGVIAYELVTGQRTFRGDSPQQVAQAIMSGPPPEPALPRPIVRVLHRCLARSPFERFPDARALADALDAALRVAPVPGTRKDIGAQVKATMDRLADLNANEMSGMVALHVGTGPVPRTPSSEIATLGRSSIDDDPVPTHEFVRPDVPVPGPAPLVSPAATLPEGFKPATTMAGVAPPPIPVPPGIARDTGLATTPPGAAPPGATLLGIARPPTAAPPRIPAIPAGPGGPLRAQSQPIPSIPRIAPAGSSAPPPVPPPVPAAPPPVPAAAPPPVPDPLQRPTEPLTPPPLKASVLDHTPAGRIEIDPPPAFDPPSDPPIVDVSMVELFDEDGPVRGRTAADDPDPALRGSTVTDDSETIPGNDPTVPREVTTQEMSRGFVERLREEAARTGNAESLSVQMEVVHPPDEPEIDPAASAARNASFAAALHEASGVFPRPVPPDPRPAEASPAVSAPYLPPPPPSPFAPPAAFAAPDAPADEHAPPDAPPAPPHDELFAPVEAPTPDPRQPLEPPPTSLAPPPPQAAPPQVRLRTAPGQGDIPSLSAPSLPPAPEKKSKLPYLVGGAVLAAAIGIGGWQFYVAMTDDDEPTAPVARGGSATPDAAVTAKAVDAPRPSADASVAAAAIDAAVARDATAGATGDASIASTGDAAVALDAGAVAAAVDAGPADAGPTAPGDAGVAPPKPTASDQLAITSKPAGAHVYLDGSDVGQTPVKLAPSNDRHTVALLLPGYELYIAEVDGKGAFEIPLKEVTPSGGPAGIKVLKCKDKDRYYVFVDGKPTGMLCPTERIDVEVGPHTVEVYDAVSESRKKWDIVVKDTRLSVRVKIE